MKLWKQINSLLPQNDFFFIYSQVKMTSEKASNALHVCGVDIDSCNLMGTDRVKQLATL